MLDLAGASQDFASLSLKDLLEARDLYHFQLINKPNVVGTAVGRYLMRRSERDGDGAARRRREPRTFENSEVRDTSWPCVLVLVERWVEEERFGGGREFHGHDMVPDALHLPDGRSVPVCVVVVERARPQPARVPSWLWPENLLGPGFPLLVYRQGAEHRATVGALVTDGHTVYALTNRHVCGTPGEHVYSMIRARPVEIGRTSAKLVTRLPMADCYPEFPSRRTYVNLDVGLCELEDASRWTSRAYGLPPVGAVAELNEANIRLQLVDAKVVAHGAASGPLEGRIKALFYRYKSVAGFDYVSDFLIAPSGGDGTQPGDSGTVWHLVPRDGAGLLRPMAIEWGGQAFATHGSAQFRFALATSLSSACKQLDVDLVRADDTGVQPYWGQTGHYDIATFACGQVTSLELKALMSANLDRVSFAESSLDAGDIASAIQDAKQAHGFVPLADVPDIVWKNFPSRVPGGRDDQPGAHGSTGPEHPTHYADVDEPRREDGKTLRQLSLEDDANIDPQVWRDFYTAQGHTESRSRGLLPFRVWQHWRAMVDALQAGDVTRFVAAAGTVSHYVGDACQPLHGSMYADGFMDQPITVEHHRREDGQVYTTQSNVGAGVHSTYESSMIDRFSAQLVDGVRQRIGDMPEQLDPIRSGRDAAKATLRLMDRTAQRLPPRELIQTFVDAGGKKNLATLNALWNAWGDQTIQTMSDGARVLAWIWDSAWAAGNGDRLEQSALGAAPVEDLQRLYTSDATFVPSLDLDHIDPALGDERERPRAAPRSRAAAAKKRAPPSRRPVERESHRAPRHRRRTDGGGNRRK
jgi:hypothetical protein